MMIIFILEIACPYFNMIYELLSYFHIWIVDKCGKVVNIITCLVEIFDRHRVRVTKTYEVLKHKSIILPHSAS